MASNDFLYLAEQASEAKDNIEKGAVGFAGYGFLFRNVDYFMKNFNLKYMCGISYIGSSKKLLREWNNIKLKEFENFGLDYYDYKIQDLYYVGAIKTLCPSLTFEGDEVLFEVGLFIKTPNDKLFPATLYWGKVGLTIGGWKKEIFGKFFGVRKSRNTFEFTPIELTDNERDEMVEALQLALQKIPISDFEGDYWTDLGGIRMGIESGIPFIKDIPIEEAKSNWLTDPDYALCYYEDEFWDILDRNHSSKDWESIIMRNYDELLEYVKKQNSRYAFQALGVFLLDYGVEITDEVRRLVLENSRWKDERHSISFKNKIEKIERKTFLFDLRARILGFNEKKLLPSS